MSFVERIVYMGTRTWLLLVAGLLIGTLTPPAFADDPTQPLVVLVGIDKYADPQIKSREHAEADAQALYDLFANKETLGVDAKHIKLLLGSPDAKRPHELATRENVLKAINWLEENAHKDDLVIFAFFGNGAPSGDRPVYFTTDSSLKDRAKNAIAAIELEHAFDKIKSFRFIAMVDCNFMGYEAPKGAVPDPDISHFYREYLGDEKAEADSLSRAVFLANSGLKPSLNLKDHGIFAQTLLDGLSGKADREGYEPDGNITMNELEKYVRKELPATARKIGKTDEEKAQLPVVLDLVTTDFVIDHNPAVYPQVLERLAKFEKIAADQMLDKTIVEQGTNYLSRMPSLDAQQKLRKMYQKLADGTLELAAFEKDRKTILDSMQLSEKEAKRYATTVLSAADVVRKDYVKPTDKGTLVDTAIRGLFRAVNEKIPSVIQDKLENVKMYKDAQLLELLTQARLQLGKREDLSQEKDVNASLHVMLGKLDKHSEYYDPEMMERMKVDLSGLFSGIGVQIKQNITKDMLQVVTPIFNSPAYRKGLQADDIITTIVREVDQKGKPFEKPEVTSTKGMKTEEAVKKILGKPGTKVKLMVEREGEEKPLEFEIVRGNVEVESVLGIKRNEDDSWNYVIDPENKICYVRLTQFSTNTARDLETVMRKLAKSGIKGFILDLRFNPGGLLDSAVRISDLFIDDGLIVTIRPREGSETSYVGKSDGSYTAFPMVCLVNGFSASASEIVSACLQDHGRAIVIGSRSYGKGSVQTIHPFDTGGQLKMTTASFWRPSGRNLNRSSPVHKDEDKDDWGVTPNPGYVVKLEPKELGELQEYQRRSEIIYRPGHPPPETTFRDRQVDMALDYLRSQIKMKAAPTNTAGTGVRKAG